MKSATFYIRLLPTAKGLWNNDSITCHEFLQQIRGEVDEGVINNLLNYSYSQVGIIQSPIYTTRIMIQVRTLKGVLKGRSDWKCR